jgi:RNase_H superfamily
VARNAIQAGTEPYGLKYLERLTKFERGHDIDKGAAAVVEYEGFIADGDQARLDRIAAYNEDDVRATLALRDWLVAQRTSEIAWRAAFLDPDPNLPEPDQHIAALHAFLADTHEHFLGDLLGYWTREWLAYIAPKMAKLQADLVDQFDVPDVVAGLEPTGLVQRKGKKGQPITPGHRFSFPQQMLDGLPSGGGTVMYLLPDGTKAYAEIVKLDRGAGELVLAWNKDKQESGYFRLAQPCVLGLFRLVTRLGQSWANLVSLGPTSATVGPRIVHLAQLWPNRVTCDYVPVFASWAKRLFASRGGVRGPTLGRLGVGG